VTTIAPSAITLMSKCVIEEITPIHTWAQVSIDDKTARKLCHFKFQQMLCGHCQLCDVLFPPLNHGIGWKTRILLLELIQLNAVLQTRTQSIGVGFDCTQHQLCNKSNDRQSTRLGIARQSCNVRWDQVQADNHVLSMQDGQNSGWFLTPAPQIA
jgi:hypothetical protein